MLGSEGHRDSNLYIPTTISYEQLMKMALLRYNLETGLFHHVTAGFVGEIMELIKLNKISVPDQVFTLLRDGLMVHSALQGLASTNSTFTLHNMKAAWINSAVTEPLKHTLEVYSPGQKAIEEAETIRYLTQLGLIKNESNGGYTLLLDSSAMGTLPLLLKQALKDKIAIGMICMAAGPLGSSKIPSYTSYITSQQKSWFLQRSNAYQMQTGAIVHTYIEDNLAQGFNRPTKFVTNSKPEEKIYMELTRNNPAGQLLGWTSKEAARTVGMAHGMLRQNNDINDRYMVN
jgi:hypothetical protein